MKRIKGWEHLKYFEYGEWQVVEERLRDLTKAGKGYCPGKQNLFRALELTPFGSVKVCFLGQDPYPDPKYASGLAFSVPEDVGVPPSLAAILKEYSSDLHLPEPEKGDLTKWAQQGVLLWNIIPSCAMFRSMSHDWPEWELLTQEILESLWATDCLFVTLGYVAKTRLGKFIDTTSPRVISVTHPSPRAGLSAKVPFAGCRLFSTINSKLASSIDWRLS